jgi:uncharacterized protein YdaU (DUF1376 family)
MSAADPLPFATFNVPTWLADTATLAPAEYFVLHRLWCFAWHGGGNLPADHALLARLVGLNSEEFDRIFARIRAWFVEGGDDAITLREVQHERERAMKIRDDRRRGAERTNAKRKETLSGSLSDTPSAPLSDNRSPDDDRSAMRSASRSAGRPSTSTSTSTPTSPTPPPTPLGESAREPNASGYGDKTRRARELLLSGVEATEIIRQHGIDRTTVYDTRQKLRLSGEFRRSQSDQRPIDAMILKLLAARTKPGDIVHMLQGYHVTLSDVNRVAAAKANGA